jgi:hypothetical protein
MAYGRYSQDKVTATWKKSPKSASGSGWGRDSISSIQPAGKCVKGESTTAAGFLVGCKMHPHPHPLSRKAGRGDGGEGKATRTLRTSLLIIFRRGSLSQTHLQP